jgi:hypothetical protein
MRLLPSCDCWFQWSRPPGARTFLPQTRRRRMVREILFKTGFITTLAVSVVGLGV